GRGALATRGWLPPVLRIRIWAYVVLVTLVLILLTTSNVSDFTRFLVVLILAGLGAVWIEFTRRQTLAEFPEAGDPAWADARARVSDWLEARRSAPSADRPS